ncbi:MAG: DUF502 domain-containing protein [Thermodesulfobacteriota bacterium]|nr:DUF502 domain-containing protein [Thermodesulfobacteriota bacterium]
MKNRIKNYFIMGLLATIPISVTIYILRVIIGTMDNILQILPSTFHPNTYLSFHIPGLGLIATLVLIFIIGVLTQSFLGRKVVSIGEWMLSKIPLVRNIYIAIKQLVGAIFVQNSREFKRVVMVEYPRKELWVIGFVTGITEGEVQTKTKKRVVNVFVPTTPNPTSGFYLLVPEKDIISLDMTVEDAFKLVVSGGIVSPPEKGEINP